MFVDSHCHLQHCYSKESLDEFLKKIPGELSYILDISVNSLEILKIREFKLPGNILLSYGLYPEFSKEFNPGMLEKTRQLALECKIDAVGEVGLDYHWDYGTPLLQERLFRSQIELSIELNLPLIIHSRDAFADTFRILSGYGFRQPVILHCFGYGPSEAEKFLGNGYYISFAGNVTYSNAKNLQQAALIVPPDKLLLETDAPYLTPNPLRGQKNQPVNVRYTYEFIAKLRNIGIESLSAGIEANFKRIFSIV